MDLRGGEGRWFLGRALWWQVPGISEERQGHHPQPCRLHSPGLSLMLSGLGSPVGIGDGLEIMIQSLCYFYSTEQWRAAWLQTHGNNLLKTPTRSLLDPILGPLEAEPTRGTELWGNPQGFLGISFGVMHPWGDLLYVSP